MTVRVAIIGAGVMGADHARIFAGDLPGAELRVVCDASRASALRVADECGAAGTETDPMTTIARDDVDAVVIASPDDTHAPLTIAAIEAGKPVLCEKPLAPSIEDCRNVMAAEIACGRRLVQLGFMLRFDPSYAEMKVALSAGKIGRALRMHNFHRNVDSPGAWFTGEMAITNSASHEFDIARFVLEAPYIGITAWQPRRSDDMAAPVMMVLETADGQIVNIEINNNAAYGYDVRGELVGEKGSVVLNAPVHARYNLGLHCAETYPADWRPRFAHAYRLQNRAWITAIETGAPSRVAANSWDGYCAARIAEAGARALNENRRVSVDVEEPPAFYHDVLVAA